MNECVTCGRTMQPLFTGMFCPNDCDRRRIPGGSSGILRATFQGQTWLVKRVRPDEKYPTWMTRSWILLPVGDRCRNEDASDEELVRHHQARWPNDWPGIHDMRRDPDTRNYTILAFGPDQEEG